MIELAFTAAEKRLLKHGRFHHPHPRVRQKMEVLWLKSQGLAPQDILRAAGITTKTMRRYFEQYREGGMERIQEVRFYRPQSELKQHQETIAAHFRGHPPASIKEAVAVIEALTGLRRSPTQVRVFLQQSCGMQRRKSATLPAKADPQVQESFKKKTSSPG